MNTGMNSPSKMGHEMAAEMQRCIQECLSCHSICTSAIAYCLQMGGEHAESNHIRMLQDCAQICITSADYMLRGSNMHGMTCAVCAEVCDLCAQDCDRFQGDSVMQQCAQACRSCASSCHQMAQSMGAQVSHSMRGRMG